MCPKPCELEWNYYERISGNFVTVMDKIMEKLTGNIYKKIDWNMQNNNIYTILLYFILINKNGVKNHIFLKA